MGPRAALDPGLLSAQEKNATKLCIRLLKNPKDFMTHVRQSVCPIFDALFLVANVAAICTRSTGALILYLTYGYEVSEDEKEDILVNIAEEAMQGFSRASEPGAYLVETLPWLKFVPDWCPGAGFKHDVRLMRQLRERLYDVPYAFVQNEMVGHSPQLVRPH